MKKSPGFEGTCPWLARDKHQCGVEQSIKMATPIHSQISIVISVGYYRPEYPRDFDKRCPHFFLVSPPLATQTPTMEKPIFHNFKPCWQLKGQPLEYLQGRNCQVVNIVNLHEVVKLKPQTMLLDYRTVIVP